MWEKINGKSKMFNNNYFIETWKKLSSGDLKISNSVAFCSLLIAILREMRLVMWSQTSNQQDEDGSIQ